MRHTNATDTIENGIGRGEQRAARRIMGADEGVDNGAGGGRLGILSLLHCGPHLPELTGGGWCARLTHVCQIGGQRRLHAAPDQTTIAGALRHTDASEEGWG